MFGIFNTTDGERRRQKDKVWKELERLRKELEDRTDLTNKQREDIEKQIKELKKELSTLKLTNVMAMQSILYRLDKLW